MICQESEYHGLTIVKTDNINSTTKEGINSTTKSPSNIRLKFVNYLYLLDSESMIIFSKTLQAMTILHFYNADIQNKMN
jgi:hypothetical protein